MPIGVDPRMFASDAARDFANLFAKNPFGEPIELT